MPAGRRASKLLSLVTSCFTSSYVRFWAQFFPETELRRTPMFDGRAVCYPTDAILRDYLAWRQADTHINNQVQYLVASLMCCHPMQCCPSNRSTGCECSLWCVTRLGHELLAHACSCLRKSEQQLTAGTSCAVQHLLLGFGAIRQK